MNSAAKIPVDPAASVLGIIAGEGRLPAQLTEACRSSGRKSFLLAFEGYNQKNLSPDAVVRIGAVGEALEHLRKAGVNEVVMAGKIQRPSLSTLRPDAAATRLLKHIGAAFFGGDDAILRALVSFFEEEGFKVVGANDVLRDLMTPEGTLGKIQPDAKAKADIAKGMAAARTIGAKDIGQGAIAQNGEVLATEDTQGTDALIERCAKLNRAPGTGVLVKMKKPGQESRVDLPAIGTETVEKIHAAGFAGIALEAAASLILDKEQTIAAADRLGVFIVGVKP
jgi:DUF1009 family protein